jgi:hypothetical protein
MLMFRVAVLAILLALPVDSFQIPRSYVPRTLTTRLVSGRGGAVSAGRGSPLLGRCEDYAEWLRTEPRWGGPLLGPIMRYINDFLVGILCTVVLRVFNRFRAVRRNVLLDQVFQRPKGQGLLTVSNHQSVFDDPGLWGAIMPFWRLRPERLRWSLCTEDIFFFVSC